MKMNWVIFQRYYGLEIPGVIIQQDWKRRSRKEQNIYILLASSSTQTYVYFRAGDRLSACSYRVIDPDDEQLLLLK